MREGALPPDGAVLQGDCRELLEQLPAGSADLILTSPPYAMRRAAQYGGIEPGRYAGWFVDTAERFKRVLSPTGNLAVNVKEGCEAGERQPWVLETILAMREAGWAWVEEFCWHKKNSMPTRPPRLRDGWERVLHFVVRERLGAHYWDPQAVAKPLAPVSERRYRAGRTADESARRHAAAPGGSGSRNSGTGSGLRMRWKDTTGLALPSNVLHLAAETANRGHPAAYPEALCDFFVLSMSPPDGLVLDPFAGSGTTLASARRLGRRSLGIEAMAEYAVIARERVRRTAPTLLAGAPGRGGAGLSQGRDNVGQRPWDSVTREGRVRKRVEAATAQEPEADEPMPALL